MTRSLANSLRIIGGAVPYKTNLVIQWESDDSYSFYLGRLKAVVTQEKDPEYVTLDLPELTAAEAKSIACYGHLVDCVFSRSEKPTSKKRRHCVSFLGLSQTDAAKVVSGAVQQLA